MPSVSLDSPVKPIVERWSYDAMGSAKEDVTVQGSGTPGLPFLRLPTASLTEYGLDGEIEALETSRNDGQDVLLALA